SYHQCHLVSDVLVWSARLAELSRSRPRLVHLVFPRSESKEQYATGPCKLLAGSGAGACGECAARLARVLGMGTDVDAWRREFPVQSHAGVALARCARR